MFMFTSPSCWGQEEEAEDVRERAARERMSRYYRRSWRILCEIVKDFIYFKGPRDLTIITIIYTYV